MKWRERAQAELDYTDGKNRRSWWVTLTFSPVHLAGIYMEAASYPSDMDRVQAVDRAAYKHVQRFFKRLRREGLNFRYLCVFELGEEKGRAHYHLFIHELGPKAIFGRHIENQWPSIVHARLVDMSKTGLASYISKYATKSFTVRPRASAGYGKPGA